MISQNLHMFVLAAPLLSGILVNLLGRLSRRWISVLTLGSLGFSTVGAFFVLLRVLAKGSFHYTVGNWTPPYGIELLVDPLSALMLLLVSGVAFLASLSAHIDLDPQYRLRQGEVIGELEHILDHRYHITHTTLQGECSHCATGPVIQQLRHRPRKEGSRITSYNVCYTKLLRICLPRCIFPPWCK